VYIADTHSFKLFINTPRTAAIAIQIFQSSKNIEEEIIFDLHRTPSLAGEQNPNTTLPMRKQPKVSSLRAGPDSFLSNSYVRVFKCWVKKRWMDGQRNTRALNAVRC
jgi:hypothetical protein